MNNINTIFRRELASFFLSPIAWVIFAVFTFFYGLFFNGIFIQFGVANLEYTLENLIVVFIFMIPLMTMRILSEERKNGTEELLMTAPVTSTEIVLGKYLALVVSFLIMESLLLIHVGIVCLFAAPDLGPIFNGLLGLLLVGISFTAIGLLTSTFSDNQIICALGSFGILLGWWLLDWLGSGFEGKTGEIINSLSFTKVFREFSKGIFDTANIIFYLSIAAVFTVLTIWRVESRRWR